MSPRPTNRSGIDAIWDWDIISGSPKIDLPTSPLASVARRA